MGIFLKRTSLFLFFMEGVLFFFALGKNPIKVYDKKFRDETDAERIAQDWRNVGNVIRTAYEKYREQTQYGTGNTDK